MGPVIAYWMYIVQAGDAHRRADLRCKLYNLSQNRFYIDEFYQAIIVSAGCVSGTVSAFFDAHRRWAGRSDRRGAGLARRGCSDPIQNGLVQFYALAMILGLTVFVVILTLRAWAVNCGAIESSANGPRSC